MSTQTEAAHHYGVAWANVRLHVEQHAHGWTAIVKDLPDRESLYESEAGSLAEAKISAVNFALVRLFGPEHTKDAAVFAESLAWEPLD